LRILGIVSKTHDSGVAFLRDGEPELVLEEERFNRDKKTKKFPKRGLPAALEELKIGPSDIDVITTPWDLGLVRRTFVGLLARRFPLSLSLTLPRAHTSQKNDIVFLNYFLTRDLHRRLGDVSLPPIVNVPHHHSHAAMFFVSPLEEALTLVMDGYGDDCSSSAYIGRGNRLERVWSTGILNSAGLVYTFVTEYLGFAGFGDEGKVMALAAYGGDTYVERFRDVVRPTPDGGYAVNMATSATTCSASCDPSSASSSTPSGRRGRLASPSPTGTATSPLRCRRSPRRSCCTGCAPCSRRPPCATSACRAASHSTASQMPRSSSTPTCGACGCRPARPTPERRLEVRSGTTTRPSVTGAASS
jgi:predicted NodU family carbamoyl transferase